LPLLPGAGFYSSTSRDFDRLFRWLAACSDGPVMNAIGVDLAWAARARSGLAAINAAGEVVSIDCAVTDEEIVDFLRPWTQVPCLVAFDAPLVVANAAGPRPCERLVNRYFGQFNAGCHPSNLGMAAFSDGGRAGRLAARLGLDVDPTSRSTRRAIEVYPHPATVMLFGLDTVLKYKNKRGRAQASMRAELLRLMSYMDKYLRVALAGSVDWQAIRVEVNSASTKAQLKHAEDRIDAVLCAYIAWYAQAEPGSVRTLGNACDGYIITPVTTAIGNLIDAASS
jgi:predicted RNase H-like nuclease